MAASSASPGENPPQSDPRRARVVWAKLGGYPLWPGVTYASWEELAQDGVQGVKQSARLRDTKAIVLFFESFQFQAVAKDCVQQFADVDHAQLLNDAKPRWKARLIQAVQDALEFIAGKSVPEIMSARKQKIKESKAAARLAASKSAGKSATKASGRAATGKARGKRKASSQSTVSPPSAPAAASAAAPPSQPATNMVKRSHYAPLKPARVLRSNSQPTEPEGRRAKTVDSQQQTVPTDITGVAQSWVDVAHSSSGGSSQQQLNPVTELREVTQRNLSMYNAMMHAAHLQQQLIGTYLAQCQQQALLTRMAREYLLHPSRTEQLLPMSYDAAGTAQDFQQSERQDQQDSKLQQQLLNGPSAHGSAFTGTSLADVFQGPAGAKSVFSEHLESTALDQSLGCFPVEKMVADQDAAFAKESLATVSNNGPDVDVDVDVDESKFDVIVVGQASTATTAAAPVPPVATVSVPVTAPAAVSPPSSPPSVTTEPTEQQEQAALKKRSVPLKDEKGRWKKIPRKDAPAKDKKGRKKAKRAVEQEAAEEAPAAPAVVEQAAAATAAATRPARAKTPKRGGEEAAKAASKATSKTASKAAKSQQSKAADAEIAAAKSAASLPRPHRHTLLAFWDLPVFSIIKTVLDEEGVAHEDAAARLDKTLLASGPTAQLASLDVRNDDWFTDESESERADEDLLCWVGEALELVAEKRSRRKQPTVARTPADVAHSLRGSDRLNAHTLIDPATYSELLPQPFTLKVHPQVSAVTDLHAHCCDAEVIGFLAGWHDAASNTLYVQFAVPCTSTERVDDGSTDVELDPEAAILAKEQILERGLHLVGWYHTHPKFKAEPSVTDVSNHHAQQNMFDHPFVGLIVSTFDAGAVKIRASHRWFHTMNHKGVIVPMVLEPTIRAIDPRHTELTVPSQYSDKVSMRVEAHLLEGGRKPDKPTSPRGVLAEQANGDAAAMPSQPSVSPLHFDGEAPEQATAEVGEPASAASSHTLVSDGSTEAQPATEAAEDAVEAADVPNRAAKRQKQEKQPAKAATKKEPRPRKATDKPRSSSAKSRKTATEALALLNASASLARNDFGAYEMLLASMGAHPEIARAFVPHPLLPAMYADAFRYAQLAAAAATSSVSTTSTTAAPAIASAPTSAPASTPVAIAPVAALAATAPSTPSAPATPPAAADLAVPAAPQVPTAPEAPVEQAQQSVAVLPTEQRPADVAPPLRGAGGPDSLSSTGEEDSSSATNNGHSRRASHRVPKRKPFDDEKVESSSRPSRAKPPGRPSKSKRKRVEQPVPASAAPKTPTAARSSGTAQPKAAHSSPIPLVRSPSRSRSDPSARDFLMAFLRAEHSMGALARRLIVTARPCLQIVVQSAVVIGIYYAAHPRRVRLLERWRQACKIDKLLYSMGSWLVYLGMADVDLQALMFAVRDFLSAAWSGQHSSAPSASA